MKWKLVRQQDLEFKRFQVNVVLYNMFDLRNETWKVKPNNARIIAAKLNSTNPRQLNSLGKNYLSRINYRSSLVFKNIFPVNVLKRYRYPRFLPYVQSLGFQMS